MIGRKPQWTARGAWEACRWYGVPAVAGLTFERAYRIYGRDVLIKWAEEWQAKADADRT